jgi:hypothetical protein
VTNFGKLRTHGLHDRIYKEYCLIHKSESATKNFQVPIPSLHVLFSQQKVSYLRSTAHHAIHLQFDISSNAREIRAVQSPQCIV